MVSSLREIKCQDDTSKLLLNLELKCKIFIDDLELEIQYFKVEGQERSLNYLQQEQIEELSRELCAFCMQNLIDDGLFGD